MNWLDVLTEFKDNNANGVYDSGDQLLTQFGGNNGTGPIKRR